MEAHREKLKAIADAIREKDGSEEPIVADEFPERILAIPSGGVSVEEMDGRYLKLTGGELVGEDGTKITFDLKSGYIYISKPDGLSVGVEGEGIIFSRYNADVNVCGDMGLIWDNDNVFLGGYKPNGEYIPVNIPCLAPPESDDSAVNKAYVNQLAQNAVKKTGEPYQIVEGVISFNSTDQVGMPGFTIASNDGTSMDVRSTYFYWEGWYEDGNGDYAFSAYPKGREEYEGANAWMPVLEFEDALIGYPGVILAGVNTPTEDYDAANKKYVDDEIKAAVGDIAALLDSINGEVI